MRTRTASPWLPTAWPSTAAAIRAGATNATLTHAALQANDHKVDGIAPTVTVGGETRTYVPPDRQFSVIFYFSEKVYGITDAEITVTNGEPHDVRAMGGNDTWPKYTRWDVIIQPAAEGPITVTLEAGAAHWRLRERKHRAPAALCPSSPPTR